MDNECVQVRKPFVVLFAAILILSLAASVYSPCVAQSSAPQAAPKSKPAPAPEARVDINHASTDELLKVPGMTPTWAGRIVRFRPYRTKQDLHDRGVVTSSVYDRIKDYVIAHRNQE